jgi:hypothetical protein
MIELGAMSLQDFLRALVHDGYHFPRLRIRVSGKELTVRAPSSSIQWKRDLADVLIHTQVHHLSICKACHPLQIILRSDA